MCILSLEYIVALNDRIALLSFLAASVLVFTAMAIASAFWLWAPGPDLS